MKLRLKSVQKLKIIYPNHNWLEKLLSRSVEVCYDQLYYILFTICITYYIICNITAVVTGAIATANALSNEVTDAVSKTKLGQKISSATGPKTKAAKEIVKSTVAAWPRYYIIVKSMVSI